MSKHSGGEFFDPPNFEDSFKLPSPRDLKMEQFDADVPIARKEDLVELLGSWEKYALKKDDDETKNFGRYYEVPSKFGKTLLEARQQTHAFLNGKVTKETITGTLRIIAFMYEKSCTLEKLQRDYLAAHASAEMSVRDMDWCVMCIEYAEQTQEVACSALNYVNKVSQHDSGGTSGPPTAFSS